MESENLDGIILAYAGVARMGFGAQIKEILPLEMMVPPSGQGAIGVETRNDQDLLFMLKPISDKISFEEVTIERELQMKIGGGCNVPLGINAAINDKNLTLHVVFGREDGEILMKDRQEGDTKESKKMIMSAVLKLNRCR
jgi:hydroxymethylbilane synthase